VSNGVEEDPSGMNQHLPGAKLDKDKLRVDLMLGGFNKALLAVAEVTTYGANKYSPNGWMKVRNPVARYADAKARHMLQGYDERYDKESGLSHAAHEAWNALAVLEFLIKGEEDEEKYFTREA